MTVEFNIPKIETERLRLRGHTLADFPASFAMWSDPDVTRFIGGKPSTEAQAWARLLNYRGLWSYLNYGYWLIEEKSSGRFVGEIGFADFKRDLEPSIKGFPEMGWALAYAMQNKGYALEAANAAIKWGEKNLQSKQIVCLISPTNEASLRLAGKLNFAATHRTLLNGEPIVLHALRPLATQS